MMSMLQDLGWRVSGEIWGDASAALGTINRRGLGKTRHIDIEVLWIQQIVAEKEIKVRQDLGQTQPSGFIYQVLGRWHSRRTPREICFRSRKRESHRSTNTTYDHARQRRDERREWRCMQIRQDGDQSIVD